ncbi:MAG: hypothetical protein GF417_01320 [Candidatus Latescibacteria bacterium]|nr:hypothetical protein [bacterium]MBD3423066.1 hypothetical protein [Candidatus Latescibacterota bacterium]
MTESPWILKAKKGLEKLADIDIDNFKMIHRPPYRSMNSGATGIPYAFWKAACVLSEPRWLHLGRFWIEKVLSMPEDSPEYELPEEKGVTARLDVDNSLYHGNRGIYFVQNLIACAQNDNQNINRSLNNLSKPETRAHRMEDVLQGRPGRLIADAILYRENGNQFLLRHGNELADSLLDSAFKYDREVPWGNNHLLGMAHGRGGIYYSLILWASQTGYLLPGWFEEETLKFARSGIEQEKGISFPIDERRPDNYMDSWCNGAPGLIHLWASAYELFGQKEFLDTARKSGEYCVMKQKYTLGHLCCGSAGASYGLLALYRIDPDPFWLKQAERFALMAEKSRFISIYPFGLYTGLSGYVCLLLDINRPDKALQPAFQ